jgi:hypothetical protein
MKSQQQQKLLAIAAASVVTVAIVFGVVKATILAPASNLDREAAQLEANIRDVRKALDRGALVARKLRELQARTFGPDEADVSEAMRERLMGLLAPSGLSTEQISSVPANGMPITRMRDREVSRTISITGGKLSHAINFLYLLAEEPHLHRFDTLSITPSQAEKGKVDLKFRYSTLAMTGFKGTATTAAATGPDAATQTAALPSLDSDERGFYKIIEERDIFRPYQKRPDPPPPPPAVATAQPPPPPPPPPQGQREPEESRWRVAGLPMMSGTEVVHVRHVQSGETRTYKIGQPLMDGNVVMIDTRMMRRYDNPKAYSDSRVILQVKDTFWAVELGDVLTQKHRLGRAELPPQLRSPTTAPAGGLSRRDES